MCHIELKKYICVGILAILRIFYHSFREINHEYIKHYNFLSLFACEMDNRRIAGELTPKYSISLEVML